MFIGRTLSIPFMWNFAWRNLLRTFIVSTLVTGAYYFFGWTFLAIPFVPIATIGTAVAFYVGFKNNQAYDRLSEARILWGGITNASRSFASSVLALINDRKKQEDIIRKHIIYINVLRLQLRKELVWASSKEDLHQKNIADNEELIKYDEALLALFTQHEKLEIYEKIKDKGNIAALILTSQYKVFTLQKRDNLIDDFEHSDFFRLLNDFYSFQGGCERIKTTPLFRQYSIFSRIFVVLFITLIPFGLLSTVNSIDNGVNLDVWLNVPISMLVSWVFYTMEQIGEFSENPFDNGINDTPISSICRNIEIDLLEMLGEKELPAKIQPKNEILL